MHQCVEKVQTKVSAKYDSLPGKPRFRRQQPETVCLDQLLRIGYSPLTEERYRAARTPSAALAH